MNYKIINETILLSLDRNEYINHSIKEFFKYKQLQFGWISGIGAIHNIELGFYDLNEKKYIKKKFLEEHEILSLIGNVTLFNNDYFVHTHITISDKNFNSMGGHLFDAQISAAGEFKIDLANVQIDRKFSKEVGLNLWCIKNGNN